MTKKMRLLSIVFVVGMSFSSKSEAEFTATQTPIPLPTADFENLLATVEKSCGIGDPPTSNDTADFTREYCRELKECVGRLRIWGNKPGFSPRVPGGTSGGLGRSGGDDTINGLLNSQTASRLYLMCLRKYLR